MKLIAIRSATLFGLGTLVGTASAQEGFPDGFDPTQPAVDAAAAGAIFIGALIGLVFFLAILALICFLVIKNYNAIPAEHRKMEPGKVWLMMIPLFNLYWAFPVFLGLADSYKSYFSSVGDESVGDCGRQLNLWYCITFCASFVPCLNYIAGPASLVLLIIVLVKAFDLKKKVEAAA